MLPMVVGAILPLVTMPIFTRILLPEDYGAFALAQVYASFMSGLANFGFTIAFDRNFFEYKEPKQLAQLFYSTIYFVLSTFTIAAIITFIFKERISGWIIGSSGHEWLLFFVFCSTAAVSVKMYFLNYFKNSQMATSYVKFAILESIFAAVFSLLYIAVFRIGVIGLALGPLTATMVVLIILNIRFIRKLPPSFNARMLLENVKLSAPLTPRIFIGVANNQFDKYILGLLGTIGGVGVYNIGQRISYMVFNIMTALQNVFGPQVYLQMFEHGEDGGRAIGKYLTPFAYISFFITAVAAFFSQEVITVLTPPSYHGAIDIVTVLALYFGIQFFGKQPQLVYTKKTYIISILSFFSLGLNIAVMIPFVKTWGSIGAAWAMFCSGILSLAIYFIIAQHYYRIKWEYGKLGAVLGILFGTSFLLLLMRYLDVAYWQILLLKLAAMTALVYVGMKIGILTRENITLIVSLIGGLRASMKQVFKANR